VVNIPSVGVKARVVNQKQVDVEDSRSDHSGCPGMRWGRGALH